MTMPSDTCGREPTVLVVAADPLQRHELVRAIAAAGVRAEGFACVGGLARARRREDPGCILLDVERPGLDGLVNQELLLHAGYEQPLIVLTGYGEVAVAVRALQRGAFDLIERPCALGALLASLEQALAVDATSRRAAGERAQFLGRVRRLTRREREVMALIVRGKANKVVAQELGISEKTVETHRGRVMGKMAVGSLAELVRLDTLHRIA
jgi:FixJ family two-component response regulator